MLTQEKRKEILQQAADLYKSGKARWGQGKWITTAATQADFEIKQPLLGVRDWFRRNVIDRNKEDNCTVCLEGAILLCLLRDPTIPLNSNTRELLDEFRGDLLAVDFDSYGVSRQGALETVGELPGTAVAKRPTYFINDKLLSNQQQAEQILADAASRL